MFDAPIAFQSLDLTGVILEVNPEWEQLSGYTAADMIGHNYLDLVPEDHLDDFRRNLERLMTDGELVGQDCFLRRKDGSIRNILIFGRIDESGERTNCRLVDITEFRCAERELADSEQRFHDIFEFSADPMVVHDGRVSLFANRAAVVSFGLPSGSDTSGVAIADFLHPDSMQLAAQRIGALLSGEQEETPAELRLMRADASDWYAEAKSAPIYIGGQRVLQTTFRDLTERKRSEAKLESYRLQLEELLVERTQSLERARHELGAIAAVVTRTVEMRDPYTAGHQRRVAALAVAIARHLEMDEVAVEHLEVAASLHDVGKVGVPAEILSKPAALTELEYALVKTHVDAGYEIVLSAAFEGDIAQVMRQHHERLDGSGYPQGLKEQDILPAAKILMVADVVEAMSSHRPYRPSLGRASAVDEILSGRGRLFDPDAVDACVSVLTGGFDFEEQPL